jgi:hypothetical protein
MWKAAQVFLSLGARARLFIRRFIQIPKLEEPGTFSPSSAQSATLPMPATPSAVSCWGSTTSPSPTRPPSEGVFGSGGNVFGAVAAEGIASSGGGFGFGNLASPVASVGSTAPQPSDELPVCSTLTVTAQALALWTRKDGMCCWLLTRDNFDPAMPASPDATGSESCAFEDAEPTCFVAIVLKLLRCALSRRHADLGHAASCLLGNLLTCSACREKVLQYMDDFGSELVKARETFSSNMMVSRMVARALRYFFEGLRVHLQLEQQELSNNNARTLEEDRDPHDNSLRRRLRKAGSLQLKRSESARRSKSPVSIRKSNSFGDSRSSAASSASTAAAAARENVRLESGSAGGEDRESQTAGDSSTLSPYRTSWTSGRMRSAFKLSSDDVFNVASDSTDKWNPVKGMVVLFDLSKANDACLLAWVAGGLRAVFAMSCTHSCQQASESRRWIEVALADRRTMLLLKLLNHPSPLVAADAMQCLALLTSVQGSGGVSPKRAVYLAGAMYSVVAQGKRALPCVTAQAAHVMANLALDPANVENMLEASNPSFKFVSFLSQFGNKPPAITIEFVGLWKDETFSRAMPTRPLRLGDLTHDTVLDRLREFVAEIREQEESEGFFALQDFDECFTSVGPEPLHERHGRVEDQTAGRDLGGELPVIEIADDEAHIYGTIAVVGHTWQNAVYHVKGVRGRPSQGSTSVLQVASKTPEAAWGARSAAVYKIALELGMVPWKESEVLVRDARIAGLQAMANMAQVCTTETLTVGLIKAGILQILLDLTESVPSLNTDELKCITQAIALIAKSAYKLLQRGVRCGLTELLDLRAAVKGLLAHPNDEIQSNAASTWVSLNMINDSNNGDFVPSEHDAPDTPPLLAMSRQTSNISQAGLSNSGSSEGAASKEGAASGHGPGIAWWGGGGGFGDKKGSSLTSPSSTSMENRGIPGSVEGFGSHRLCISGATGRGARRQGCWVGVGVDWTALLVVFALDFVCLYLSIPCPRNEAQSCCFVGISNGLHITCINRPIDQHRDLVFS